jgi:hypothetical protein
MTPIVILLATVASQKNLGLFSSITIRMRQTGVATERHWLNQFNLIHITLNLMEMYCDEMIT